MGKLKYLVKVFTTLSSLVMIKTFVRVDRPVYPNPGASTLNRDRLSPSKHLIVGSTGR